MSPHSLKPSYLVASLPQVCLLAPEKCIKPIYILSKSQTISSFIYSGPNDVWTDCDYNIIFTECHICTKRPTNLLCYSTWGLVRYPQILKYPFSAIQYSMLKAEHAQSSDIQLHGWLLGRRIEIPPCPPLKPSFLTILPGRTHTVSHYLLLMLDTSVSRCLLSISPNKNNITTW